MGTEPKPENDRRLPSGGLCAYTDESGNTGSNLFDEKQPWFWTATVLSTVDLDTAGAADRRAWLEELGVEELHASMIGPERVEQVADRLLSFIIEHDCRVVFTRVEKRTVASLKLVDTLLDSTSNMALSPVLYGNRFPRMFFANLLAQHISPKSQEEFWSVFQIGDVEGFRRLLRRLHWNIQQKCQDRRAQELLLDAIGWAIEHPEEFPELRVKRNAWDSPNFIAFTMLMDLIHDECERTGLQIRRFVHDEQNQFAAALRQAYGVGRRIKFSTGTFAWMTDLEKVAPWEADLEFISSGASLGVELADVVLWLMRRRVERAIALPAASGRFLDWAGIHGVVREASREQLQEDVSRAVLELWDRQITAEEEAKGKEMVRKLEEQRKRRMLGLE
jgi:hypothetical protein